MNSTNLSSSSGGSPPDKPRRRRRQLDGEAKKDRALTILERRRPRYIQRAQRAMTAHALEHGEATADDVRAVVNLPEGMNPKLFGAVPRALVSAGVIRQSGFTKSKRPVRHAAPIAVWELADAEKARRWLDDNPERDDDLDDDHDAPSAALDPAPDPLPLAGHAAEQGELFGHNEEEPSAPTPGSNERGQDAEYIASIP